MVGRSTLLQVCNNVLIISLEIEAQTPSCCVKGGGEGVLSFHPFLRDNILFFFLSFFSSETDVHTRGRAVGWFGLELFAFCF